MLIDWRYLCKALGDAQCKLRADKDPVYEPTQDSCCCADIQYKDRENRQDANGDHYDGPCKHMIREMLLDPLLDVDQVMFRLIGADIPSTIMIEKEIEL